MGKSLIVIIILMNIACLRQTQENEIKIPIPLPSDAQLRWQNYEQTMFIHFSANTWQTHRGLKNEFDDLSTPLDRLTRQN